MTERRLEVSREQILAYRRSVQALDERLPNGEESLQVAAWAGLQDSMPRAALLSIHARVADTGPSTWEDPALVQVWGPRFSAYVVAGRDRALFTLSRLPDEPKARKFAQDLAARVHAFLDGRAMSANDVGHALGIHPVSIRYAAPTGTLLIRWDGARRPTVWTVPAPEVDPREARLELARRYVHIFGPTTAESFADWVGIGPKQGREAFTAHAESLLPVRTPVGDAWILTSDESTLRTPEGTTASARLIPSGDTYFLLQGTDRELLVPEADRRSLLWTSRVWPGAVLVNGEIGGTWRRAEHLVTIEAWQQISQAERDAVEAEAESMRLPGLRSRIVVSWARAQY